MNKYWILDDGCLFRTFFISSIYKLTYIGGDIFKFAGDAMIVLWPPPQNNTDEELTTLVRQAIQSAMDIQARLHDMKLVEDIKLSVKIGFGIGQVEFYTRSL
jgi:class 3 adenylate cyclase